MTKSNTRKATHTEFVGALQDKGHNDPVVQNKISAALSDEDRGSFIEFLEMMGATPAEAEQAADQAQGKKRVA
jgi:hypothetical protein